MLKINLEKLNKEIEDMDIVIESVQELGINAKGKINFRLIGLDGGDENSWLCENKFKFNKHGDTEIDIDDLVCVINW